MNRLLIVVAAVCAATALTLGTMSAHDASPAKALVSPPIGTVSFELYGWTMGSNDHSHFLPIQRVTAPDGRGGSITAVRGILAASTDGRAQQVFFWHNRSFARLAAHHVISVVNMKLQGNGHSLRVGYLTDPPSHWVWVKYRWNGSRLVSSRPAPCSSCLRMARSQSR